MVLFLSLIFACLIRNGSVQNLLRLEIYHNMMIFVIVGDLFLIIMFESYKGVLRRDRYQELRSVISWNLQWKLNSLYKEVVTSSVLSWRVFSEMVTWIKASKNEPHRCRQEKKSPPKIWTTLLITPNISRQPVK